MENEQPLADYTVVLYRPREPYLDFEMWTGRYRVTYRPTHERGLTKLARMMRDAGLPDGSVEVVEHRGNLRHIRPSLYGEADLDINTKPIPEDRAEQRPIREQNGPSVPTGSGLRRALDAIANDPTAWANTFGVFKGQMSSRGFVAIRDKTYATITDAGREFLATPEPEVEPETTNDAGVTEKQKHAFRVLLSTPEKWHDLHQATRYHIVKAGLVRVEGTTASFTDAGRELLSRLGMAPPVEQPIVALSEPEEAPETVAVQPAATAVAEPIAVEPPIVSEPPTAPTVPVPPPAPVGRVQQPIQPPVILGPTPANPFGGGGRFDIADIFQKVEDAELAELTSAVEVPPPVSAEPPVEVATPLVVAAQEPVLVPEPVAEPVAEHLPEPATIDEPVAEPATEEPSAPAQEVAVEEAMVEEQSEPVREPETADEDLSMVTDKHRDAFKLVAKDPKKWWNINWKVRDSMVELGWVELQGSSPVLTDTGERVSVAIHGHRIVEEDAIDHVGQITPRQRDAFLIIMNAPEKWDDLHGKTRNFMIDAGWVRISGNKPVLTDKGREIVKNIGAE
jgi:hypothetical protein